MSEEGRIRGVFFLITWGLEGRGVWCCLCEMLESWLIDVFIRFPSLSPYPLHLRPSASSSPHSQHPTVPPKCNLPRKSAIDLLGDVNRYRSREPFGNINNRFLA
jgi:hypothetical protein